LNSKVLVRNAAHLRRVVSDKLPDQHHGRHV
jgi:hypothetical protein